LGRNVFEVFDLNGTFTSGFLEGLDKEATILALSGGVSWIVASNVMEAEAIVTKH
jgi:hypothetical protein